MLVGIACLITATLNPLNYTIVSPPLGARVFQPSGKYVDWVGEDINLTYGLTFFRRIKGRFLTKDFPKGEVYGTALEFDIRRKNKNGEEESVPLYEQYNHHWSMGSFSVANGAESRQTFKGYPSGYGQKIKSIESQFANTHAMVIGSLNPSGKRTGFPQPKSSNAPDQDQMYNFIVECPCTTRINKTARGLPESYVGGVYCCNDGDVILDADQTAPSEVQTVYYRFRLYYTEDKSTRPVQLSSNNYHEPGSITEFNIPACKPGTPSDKCIYNVSVDLSPYHGPGSAEIIRITHHQHSPSALYASVIDVATGKEVCRLDSIYGKTDVVFDEIGYMHQQPCIWGHSDELSKPPIVTNSTSYKVVFYNSNTVSHYGSMAYIDIFTSPLAQKA